MTSVIYLYVLYMYVKFKNYKLCILKTLKLKVLANILVCSKFLFSKQFFYINKSLLFLIN